MLYFHHDVSVCYLKDGNAYTDVSSSLCDKFSDFVEESTLDSDLHDYDLKAEERKIADKITVFIKEAGIECASHEVELAIVEDSHLSGCLTLGRVTKLPEGLEVDLLPESPPIEALIAKISGALAMLND